MATDRLIRWAVAMSLGVLMVSAACSSNGSGDTAAPTRTVGVDARTPRFNGAFLAYFPNQVAVHPGDTVAFRSVYNGEPHTVTMGTLVDKGLAAAKASDPKGPPPAEFATLPVLTPQTSGGDIHQNAANPCFLAAGSPPSDVENRPCAQVAQPAFDGTQTYYSSGFLPPGAVFRVKVAPATKPGTYSFYCSLHGPRMSGSIVVKPKGTSTPSSTDVNRQGRAQLDATVAKLARADAEAKAGRARLPGNLAGLDLPDVPGAFISQYYPATIRTGVGQKVMWTFIGVHTVSFGVPGDADAVFVSPAGGGLRINPKAALPAGGPGEESLPEPATPAPAEAAPQMIDGGTYDGSGFKSSGVVESFPDPGLVGYSLTFTKAGTYPYLCTIHPGMGGVVIAAG
jgi:plastocyanin